MHCKLQIITFLLLNNSLIVEFNILIFVLIVYFLYEHELPVRHAGKLR